MTPWCMTREGSFDFEVDSPKGNAGKINVIARLPVSKASLLFAQNKSACGELSRVSPRGGNSAARDGTSDVEGCVRNGGQAKRTVARSASLVDTSLFHQSTAASARAFEIQKNRPWRLPGNASCGVLPSIMQASKRDLSAAIDLSGINAVGKMQESCLGSGKRWRQRRPPPVKVAKPDMHHLAGFYSEAFVAGTPGRMKQPLQDALEKLTSEELDCTLAVWDSSRRNLHDPEKFQEHFEKFGAVDSVHACCPRIAPGFVLVKMKSAVTIENMLPPSGFRQLDGATMSVHNVRQLARDIGIEVTK